MLITGYQAMGTWGPRLIRRAPEPVTTTHYEPQLSLIHARTHTLIQDSYMTTLTVQLKENGSTSFPFALSGSARRNEFPPKTGLLVFPNEHDPKEVTLI